MKNYPNLRDRADMFYRFEDGRVTIDRPHRARRSDATGCTDRTYDPTPASRARVEMLVYGREWPRRQYKSNGWVGLGHGPTPHLDQYHPDTLRTAQYLRRLDEAQDALDQAYRLVKDALREIEVLRDEMEGHA